MRHFGTALWLGIVGSALSTAPAAACAVCYGAAEDPMIEGAQLAIVFMLGLTYAVVGGGIAAALVLRKNARKGESTDD